MFNMIPKSSSVIKIYIPRIFSYLQFLFLVLLQLSLTYADSHAQPPSEAFANQISFPLLSNKMKWVLTYQDLRVLVQWDH